MLSTTIRRDDDHLYPILSEVTVGVFVNNSLGSPLSEQQLPVSLTLAPDQSVEKWLH